MDGLISITYVETDGHRAGWIAHGVDIADSTAGLPAQPICEPRQREVAQRLSVPRPLRNLSIS